MASKERKHLQLSSYPTEEVKIDLPRSGNKHFDHHAVPMQRFSLFVFAALR